MGGRVVVVDVDGVVSAVYPRTSAWGDEVVAGSVFGPVMVSPTLCRRLDALATLPGVECVWLTSWDARMRAAMQPFPGSTWRTVTGPEEASALPNKGWWKLAALDTWLASQRDVEAVAWCDDHLRGGRPAAARRRLARRGLDVLLLHPDTAVGLTPEDLQRLQDWTQSQ